MTHPPKPRRRLAAGLATALAAALAVTQLAGCSDLPTAGAVRQGIAATPTDVGYPQFVPQDPDVGAGPQAIVQGFLLATQAGPSEGFAAARRYLTPAAALAWEPLAQVNLYSDSRPPEPVAPLEADSQASIIDSVEVQVPFDMVGTVDDQGRYAPSPPTASSQSFTVTKDSEGMWRISVAPSGLLLSLGEFVTQFRASPVYYVDSAGQALIPDVRWFARADAASHLVDAFLAGPPAWLSPVAANPVPIGITADVVQHAATAGGADVLSVELSATAVVTPPRDRGRIVAALTASLGDLPGVGTVEVRCRDERWDSPAGPSLVRRPNDLSVYTVETDAVVRRGPGDVTEPVAGFDPPAVEALTTLTVAVDAAALAGLDTEGRVLLLRPDDAAAHVVTGDSGGVAPAFDASGRLWIGLGSGSAGAIASVSIDGSAATVAADWLADEALLALAPAPDTRRLLVISQDDTSAVRVRLAAIGRDPWGVPVELGEPTL
ncbi:MAG: LpqB family beta-propeller domain-containing protein, partial [Bifidobacteriaceae bacterium]|nr:LpqB family beta-propeller domain-containing protein [Bifidobacteriaceae bacterium]